MTKGESIRSFQGMRAIAFLGIFLSHCGISALGEWGVSIFFVMSGFLMMHRYGSKSMDVSARFCLRFSFWKISKIYPLHVLMTVAAIPLAVYSLLNGMPDTSAVSLLRDVALHAALLQAWIPDESVYFGLNGVAWYLSACVVLYALFPPLLRLFCRIPNRKTGLLIAAGVYCAQIFVAAAVNMALAGHAGAKSSIIWFTYIFPLFRLGDFSIGCCLGAAFSDAGNCIDSKSATLLEALIFAGWAILYSLFQHHLGIGGMEWFRHTLLYLPVTALAIYVFAMEKGIISGILSCKPLVLLGNISAYMFLIHQIVIRYVVVFIHRTLQTTPNPWLAACVSLPVTILLSALCERYAAGKHLSSAQTA